MIWKRQTAHTVRIALVGSYPPPHGGQSVHIASLSEYLRAEGIGVTIFNTGSSKDSGADEVVQAFGSISLFRAMLFNGRYELLHVHVSTAEDFGKLAPVRLAAMIRRVPWLATIHSGNSVNRLQNTTRLSRAFARVLLGSAGRIICVNAAISDQLSTLVERRVCVVIPPFSVKTCRNTLSADAEQFLQDHSPVICCVGLYSPPYGFEHAVHVVESIRKVYPAAGLMLIGDTKGADWCRAQIAELSLTPHVKLCGDLAHEQCLSIIGRASLFLRPTLYDGDSLSVREALALQVPVVASATDFRPEGVILYRVGKPTELIEKALFALRTNTNIASLQSTDRTNLEKVRQLYTEMIKG